MMTSQTLRPWSQVVHLHPDVEAGDTAVASYRLRVRYEHGGQEHDETGGELMVFARQEDGWRSTRRR